MEESMRPPRWNALFAAIVCAAAGAAPAMAQNYPNRPISFVVPFAPGGPVGVENKTGASGVVGATHVWRAEPDGYTLLVNALADVQNLHYIKVPYNAVDDFTLIGKISDGPPMVLIANADLPYKSLKELIDLYGRSA